MSLHIDALADLVRQSVGDSDATREDWQRAIDQVFSEEPGQSVPERPGGFWAQISHQLARIRRDKPDTFDAVRAILLDPTYTDVVAEINRNGETSFGDDVAFFAGSGGDESLQSALVDAGWQVIEYRAYYFYALEHDGTGERLTYIEGDVQRGNTLQA